MPYAILASLAVATLLTVAPAAADPPLLKPGPTQTRAPEPAEGAQLLAAENQAAALRLWVALRLLDAEIERLKAERRGGAR